MTGDVSAVGLAQFTSHYGFSRNYGTTRVFAPPEFFNQPEHNLQFDIYQAGLTLYRMCNGDDELNLQFQDNVLVNGVPDSNMFVNNLAAGNFPNRSKYLPHIPKALKSVVNKALNIDLNLRYKTVIDILNDLSKIDFANEWRYEREANGNDKWTWDKKIVIASFNGWTWEVLTKQSNKRVLARCGAGLTEFQKNQLLYNTLAMDW